MTLKEAVRIYCLRKERKDHPDGEFDKGGRFYPSDDEHRKCCDRVRSPSRSYPYSLMTHCRTITHIANLAEVSESELRKAIRKESPPQREGGEGYYKAVAVKPDGRYVSIYDGQTEYMIGVQVTRQIPRRDHGGGYYCYRSYEEAKQASVPRESKAADLPRAVLKVRAEGLYCTYGDKLAFATLTPVKIVEEVKNA